MCTETQSLYGTFGKHFGTSRATRSQNVPSNAAGQLEDSFSCRFRWRKSACFVSMILDDAVEGAASPRILPRVGGNKDGTCTPSTFKTSGRTKTRKTSKMKSGLLFDPLAVVFEVVVVIFYASDVGEKSGENRLISNSRVLITLERTTRTNLLLLQI